MTTEEFFADGKKYISSKVAGEISGYTTDYIGQLCRAGKIEGKLIGKTWFVNDASLSLHKNQILVKRNRNNFLRKSVVEDVWDSELFSRPPSLGSAHTPFAPVPKSLPVRGTQTGMLVKAALFFLIISFAGSLILWKDTTVSPEFSSNETAVLDSSSSGSHSSVSALSRLETRRAVTTFNRTVLGFYHGVNSFFGSIKEGARALALRTKNTLLSFLGLQSPEELLEKQEEISVEKITLEQREIVELRPAPDGAELRPAPDGAGLRRELALLKEQGLTTAAPALTLLDVKELVERIVRGNRFAVTQADVPGVSPKDLETELSILENKLRQEIYRLSDTGATSRGEVSAITRTVALSQKIDQLSGVALTNTTVSGTFTGLSDAHIPDDITASNYLTLSGGTLTGALTGTDATFSGDLTVSGSQTFSGALTISSFTATSTTATSTIESNFAILGNTEAGIIISGAWRGTEIGETFGGTGQTTYSTGDILFASGVDSLARLATGANGQVLKLTAGLPAWEADLQGGGGAGFWATTTDDLITHPTDTSDVVVVGSNATSTLSDTNLDFEVFGGALFDAGTLYVDAGGNRVGIGTTTPWGTFSVESTADPIVVFADQANDTTPFIINGSGNVGIGDTTPTEAKLVVNAASGVYALFSDFSTASLYITNDGNGNVKLRTDGTQEIAFYPGNTEKVRFTDGGNVGIGTTSPAQLLHISDLTTNAGLRVESEASSIAFVQLQQQGTTTGWQIESGRSGVNDFNIRQGNGIGDVLTLTNAGNVGIGITSPTETLHIRNDASGSLASGIILQNRQAAANTEIGIKFIADTQDESDNRYSLISGIGHDLRFLTASGAAPAERMRILSTGNVGIGTTSPTSALTVIEGLNVAVTTADYAATIVNTTNNPTTHGLLVGNARDESDSFIVNFGRSDATTGVFTSRMVLTTLGNVGIGTTSPTDKLQIESGHFGISTGPSNTTAEIHFYEDGARRQTIFYDTVNNFLGVDEFGVATHFVIKDGGNVGIGVTDPDKRLEVFETVADAQLKISYDATRFANLQVDSVGDLIIDPQGNDVFLNDDNLFICTGGACPSGTPTGTGNLIVEGNVGIGTTSPQDILHIENSGNFGMRIANTGNTSSDFSVIRFFQSGVERASIFSNQNDLYVRSASTNDLLLQDSGGNVGIGTTTPAQTLSVAGTIYSGSGGIQFPDGTIQTAAASGGVDLQVFTSSGTYTKPAGAISVLVMAWGGGGGGEGSAISGGGGGAYVSRVFDAADVGATETVTVGAGGALVTAGGDTTFGALLKAFGGGFASNGAGGGGGGAVSAGAPGIGAVGGDGGDIDGGAGGTNTNPGGMGRGFGGGGGGGQDNIGGDANAYGGAGGAGRSSTGGSTIYGGGGGSDTATAGTSIFGGNGGTDGNPGVAPGGGAGAGSTGANGRVEVYTWN